MLVADVVQRGETMKKFQDAYGQAMYDFHCGNGKTVFIERDDGYIDLDRSIEGYFSDFQNWGTTEKKAIRYCNGRVLDIGCGAGRHSLYLQRMGFKVLGIDVSPLAIKTCKLRGLKNVRVVPIDSVSTELGAFGTILMLGNNFGLFGSFSKAKRLLKRFHRLTSDEALIIAEYLDPYDTTEPCHLKYHKKNRARKRMSGQLRLRVRYQDAATPWFDYLFVCKDEMKEILEDTSWRIRKIINSKGPTYIAIIEKTLRYN